MSKLTDLRIPRTRGRLASTIKIKAGPDLDSLLPLLAQFGQIGGAAASALGAVSALSRLGVSLGPNAPLGMAGLNLGPGGATGASRSLSSMALWTLGEVTSISRETSREVERRYCLGQNSFEPFQVVPLKIKTSLSLKRVVMYSMSDLQKIYGFFPENLTMQQFPFMIQEEKYSQGSYDNADAVVGAPGAQTTVKAPVYPEDRKVDIVNLYFDCWFTSLPMQFDIMAENQLVVQEAKVECGRMVSYDGSFISQVLAASEGLGAVDGLVSNAVSVVNNLSFGKG